MKKGEGAGGGMEWSLYSGEPIMEIPYVPASAIKMMLTFTPRGPG